MNVVVLIGTLSRDPDHKDLPSGDCVLAFDVTTRVGGDKADSVPVAWFEPPASAPELTAGAAVVVTGRVRRRFFRTPGGTQSRTEVVADHVVLQRQRKRAQGVVDRAAADLALALATAGTSA
jgi:single-strand DNA-binding protein